MKKKSEKAQNFLESKRFDFFGDFLNSLKFLSSVGHAGAFGVEGQEAHFVLLKSGVIGGDELLTDISCGHWKWGF